MLRDTPVSMHKEGDVWEQRVKGSVQILTCLSVDTPFLFWLRSCLDLSRAVQVLMLKRSLCTWFLLLFYFTFYLLRSWVEQSTTPPPLPKTSPAHLHEHLSILFEFFPICIYIRAYFLLVRSNDNSRMLFSVSYCVPTGTVWRLAGDMLHIPWAQDLIANVVLWMLWGTAGLVCLPPPVEQSTSIMARNSFAKLVRTVREEEEEEESLLGIILSVSCVVHLSIILLFSDYLTHVFTCHLLKHVCVLQHSCFQSVCEIAAAGKRNTSSWFKSCMGHLLFFF